MKHEALPQVPGFRVLRRLGTGARGTVFLAIQHETEREVALKLFAPLDDPDASLPEAIEHERRIAASLRHRNLVRIHASGQYGDRHWLACEYLSGGSLAECIGKGLPTARALDVVRDLLHGLGHAHARGVIHGDVKPANILFRGARCSGEAVLADYGVAAWDGSGQPMGGTPGYMSPEQARGEPIDARADFHALGRVLHEMLTGLPPMPEADAAIVSRAIPRLPVRQRWLQPLLDALLAEEPSDRPADARTALNLLASLRAASPEAESLALRPDGSEPLLRIHGVDAPPSSRAGWLIVALLLLALIGMALVRWQSWLG